VSIRPPGAIKLVPTLMTRRICNLNTLTSRAPFPHGFYESIR
jgi:hypothetical protein